MNLAHRARAAPTLSLLALDGTMVNVGAPPEPLEVPEIEIIDASRIDEAYDRVVAGDVRYRFVIDASTSARGPSF